MPKKVEPRDRVNYVLVGFVLSILSVFINPLQIFSLASLAILVEARKRTRLEAILSKIGIVIDVLGCVVFILGKLAVILPSV